MSYLLAYLYPTYTQATINSDGSLNTTGIGYVTEKLPVIPGEEIWLNSTVYTQVAFYSNANDVVAVEAVTSGLNSYTVPSSATFAVFATVYNGGQCKPLAIRAKNPPKNKTFADLIFSPLKTRPTIGITGDSNTKGYGLSDSSLSWANLLAAELEKITTMNYSYDSPWVESIGASDYSNTYNFKTGSQMTIWTDTAELELTMTNNYSSEWQWYVNDTLLEAMDSATIISLDGESNKITVKFTSGQAVSPMFKVPKTITFENAAVVGVSTSNVVIPENKDWLIMMLGTNNRSGVPYALSDEFWKYAGKGTYIMPFPNHKTDSSYAVSEMQTYHTLQEIFRCHQYEIIDCSDVNAHAFSSNTLYQSDLIHFNEMGHKVICNMVSGKMGVPAMLNVE